VARLNELKNGSRPEEIAQMKANMDNMIATQENAKLRLDRVTQLRAQNMVSQQEVDDALMNYKTSSAQVDSAAQQWELMKAGPRKEQIAAQDATVAQLKAALDNTKLDLENTIIRAPMDATILERNVERGEFVTTGFVGDRGAKGFVVSIADLNDLLVELDVSQSQFAKVQLQQPCTIVTDAYPDRKYEGSVQLIAPVANRSKATVQVRVKVKKPDELLKPDMNATVSFLSPPKSATQPTTHAQPERPNVRIPQIAVHDGTVMVMEGGKAVTRKVTVGRTASGGDIEITDGLIGGEELIIRASRTPQNGEAVRLSGARK
jgi:HlyD family secretion protein